MKSFWLYNFINLMLILALIQEAEAKLKVKYPQAPLWPTDLEQCQELSEAWSKIMKQVSDAHMQCLNAHKKCKGYKGSSACSCHKCQQLHTINSSSELRRFRSDQMTMCQNKVYAHQRQVRETNRERMRREQNLIPIKPKYTGASKKQSNSYQQLALKQMTDQANWSSKKLAVQKAKKKAVEFKLLVETQKRLAKVERRATLAADFIGILSNGGTPSEKLSVVTRAALEAKYSSPTNPLSNLLFARAMGNFTTIFNDSLNSLDRELQKFSSGNSFSGPRQFNMRLKGLKTLRSTGIPEQLSDLRRQQALNEGATNFEKILTEVSIILIEEKRRAQLAHYKRERERQFQDQRTVPTQQTYTQRPLSPSRNTTYQDGSDDLDRRSNCTLKLYEAVNNGTSGLSNGQLFQLAEGDINVLIGTRWSDCVL